MTRTLAVAVLLASAPALAQPVCIPREDYERAVQVVNDYGACKRDLRECRRREAVPLPQFCTPTFVTVEKPVPVVVERASWTAVVVGVVVGFVGGFVAAWRAL